MSEPTINDADTSQGGRRTRGRGFGLSIQSKLMLMLLAVGLLSALVVGTIGYLNGRSSLKDAAFDQLTTTREVRAEAIEHEFGDMQLGVRLDSRNLSAVEGASAFIEGFQQLQSASLSTAQREALTRYYAEDFVPALNERSGLEYAPEAFVPATPAGRYLQAHYTIQHRYDDFEAGLEQTDAGDGSAWTRANVRYGEYFTGLIDELGYEDVLVIDTKGNVVYSAYKSTDLGVKLTEEPYVGSVLTNAVREVLRSGSLDRVVTTDFERYLPSLNVPTAWVLSPTGTTTNITGVLAVQVPISQINDVMTGGERWADEGLGETGEVYLAGPDRTMRSVSRLLIEHPEDYVDTVVENGTSPTTAERIWQVNGTVSLQPVDYYAVDRALAGKAGTALAAEYTNDKSLVAYSPLEIDGLNWVIVAHIDESEAFEPVTDFTRTLLLWLLGIALAISFLSLLFAQVFTRPIRRLVDAVRHISGGDLAVQVPQGTPDEFGDLGRAFNDMAASLRIKQELIDDQRVENDKLLHSLMPESVAKRYQQGEEAIAEQHDNVAVVFAELVGFDDFSSNLPGDEEISKLNNLMRGFDDAAEEAGVEKVRALRGGYLASSGLVIPRVDNVRRALEFTRLMQEVVQRFNDQHGSSVDLRAGIDTGTVTSGLVARTNLAYDLWGDAVNLAYRVRSVTDDPGIYVSQAVRDRMGDVVRLIEVGTIELKGQTQTVWKVD